MHTINFIKFSKILVISFLFFPTSLAYGQPFQIPDSLKNKNYKELSKSFLKIYEDTLISKVYLNTWLQKAIIAKDSINQARALNYLSYYAENEKTKLSLLDQAIVLSENLNDEYFPTIVYSYKAGYYYNEGNYFLALKNYLKTLQWAQKKKDTTYIYITKHNIASIKSIIGKHDEALDLFKECLIYENGKKDVDTTNYDYAISLLTIAESYKNNKMYDSSSIYNSRGLLLSKLIDSDLYSKFLLNEGITLYYKEQYNNSYDSIKKAISNINAYSPENIKTVMLCEFYMGKLANKTKYSINPIYHFVRLDSIIQKSKNYIPEVRDGYRFLIENYKSNLNKDKQLEYITKLVLFDSVINSQRKFVSDKLFKEYQIPELLSEKQKIISSLKTKNKRISKNVIFITFLLLLSLLGLGYYYFRQHQYKNRFIKLLDQSNKTKKVTKVNHKEDSISGIPIETTNLILDQLKFFENEHKYIENTVILGKLAKDFGTNSRYLSLIINKIKGKNFIQYVNDLRVDYGVHKLKNDTIFRKYTIKAISIELGFNNPESFSKAFYKKTGIYPSYFIKEIEKQESICEKME